jgi:DNA-binding NarL/FixJ family response regulator
MPEEESPLKRAARSSQRSRSLLLIDPDPVSRDWLVRILRPAGAVAAVASARREAITGRLSPFDLSVLSMGSLGLEEAEMKAEIDHLIAHFPDVPLALFVREVRPEDIQRALHLGVRGYIPIFVRPHEMLEGLRIMFDNGIFIPALDTYSGPTNGHRQVPVPEAANGFSVVGPLRLTLREAQILELLREDRTNREIADALNLAESTVKVHIRHILCELNAGSRAEAVEIADRLLAQSKVAFGGRPNLPLILILTASLMA